MSARLTERIRIQVTREQLKALDRLADRDGSSRAEQVRVAIRAHLARCS